MAGGKQAHKPGLITTGFTLRARKLQDAASPLTSAAAMELVGTWVLRVVLKPLPKVAACPPCAEPLGPARTISLPRCPLCWKLLGLQMRTETEIPPKERSG